MHPTTTHRSRTTHRRRVAPLPALRRSAGAFVAASVLLVSACGDDTVDPAGQSSGETIAPPATTTPETTLDTTPGTAGDGEGIEHPTGADDVVVSIERSGGFVPIEIAFTTLPDLVVTGDGTRYSQGAQVAVYPGPLLPVVEHAEVGESTVQELLALAADLDLLRDLDLEGGEMVADAASTIVTISAGGHTYEHSAYALGIGGLDGDGETGDRAALESFVEQALVMAGEGEAALFDADSYYVATYLVGDLSAYTEEPTLQEWPATAPVELAAIEQCDELPGDFVAATFGDADTLTFFTEGDATYQVVLKPVYPGVHC